MRTSRQVVIQVEIIGARAIGQYRLSQFYQRLRGLGIRWIRRTIPQGQERAQDHGHDPADLAQCESRQLPLFQFLSLRALM
jgi:hypothetical protein